jgi:hypothetical protein
MHSSILRQDLAQFHGIVLGVFPDLLQLFSDFQLFQLCATLENAHLVHQHWYRISFTF